MELAFVVRGEEIDFAHIFEPFAWTVKDDRPLRKNKSDERKLSFFRSTPKTISATIIRNMAERKLKLLCLDGGGVRGLSSLFILKQLMEAINPDDPPKPCNYFDMIGGTSTGG
jgi:predicted acylesterase/phospholipase RssA